jgi:hypothetical protein
MVMTPKHGFLVNEAVKIAEKAREKDVILRLIGAVAIRVHSPKFSFFQEKLGRELSDIDFIAYSRQRQEIAEFFLDLGYEYDRRIISSLIPTAQYVFEGTSGFHVDVFFDKLEMCHTIDFNGQLEVDYPTISLANLLLEKMQIVQLNEKDAIDTTILLREHDVGESDVETINANYVSKLLSKDWGFYYTVTTNLKRVKDEFLTSYSIPDKDKTNIKDKINILLERIEGEPKSLGWKMRAKVGTKKRWYRDVEELYR